MYARRSCARQASWTPRFRFLSCQWEALPGSLGGKGATATRQLQGMMGPWQLQGMMCVERDRKKSVVKVAGQVRPGGLGKVGFLVAWETRLSLNPCRSLSCEE